MSKALSKLLLSLCLISLLCIPALATIFLFETDYKSFIETLRITLQKEISWVPFLQSKLPESRYRLIKITVLIFDALAIAIVLFAIPWFTKIQVALDKICTDFKNGITRQLESLKKLARSEKILICLILLVAAIRSFWFIWNLPVQYDEAWIYNYFIGNGIKESFLLPSNNHKLYTFISWWFNLLPFDKKILIRLPNVVIGLITCLVSYLYLKKYFKSISIPLIGLAWFSSCVPVAQYMIVGKSYIYVLLFQILLIYFYQQILNVKSKLLYFWLLTVTILGYFANPIFFFGHFSATVFFLLLTLIQKKYLLTKRIIFTNLCALFALGILYSVDILSGSFSELLKFAVTQKIDTENFFILCLDYNAQFITGFSTGLIPFCLIIISGMALCLVKHLQYKSLLVYSVSSIIWLPFYAAIVKDDTSVHKTIYITFSFLIVLLFLLRKTIARYCKTPARISVFLFFILTVNFYLLRNNSWFNWGFPIDNSVQTASNILLKEKAGSCYLSHYYYKPGLEFNFKTNHKKLKMFMGVPGSLDYSADTVNFNHADFIILSKDLKSENINNSTYYRIFGDPFIIIYKRREVGLSSICTIREQLCY